jgi:hyperosmotically inducible periplasmic protein
MVRTDEEIRNDILKHLEWDGRLESTDINVRVEQGNVTLTGVVSNYLEKEAAGDDARDITGVLSVDNELIIQFPPPGGLPSDEMIRSRVYDVVKWNSDIDISCVEFTVNTGWLILEGSVDVYWKKLRIEELAGSVYGVAGITNEISVVPSHRIEDRAIARNIVMALERNSNVNAYDITVEVNNGRVTLTGMVNSQVEKKTAQEVACYTAGVQDVENEIVVRSPEYSYSK